MSLRLYLLVGESSAGLFHRLSKAHRDVRSLITHSILPNIDSALSEGYLPERYPWCFVISPATLRRKEFCVGAFMVLPNEKGEKMLIIVYSAVSCRWLQKNMQAEFPMTFWAARILNSIDPNHSADNNWQPLRQWVKALKRAYSPFWQSFALTPVWRFSNYSQVLLREGSQEDCRISCHDGIEVMPWKNWPDCMQKQAGVWIWRQSRHRKILDSQRILLPRGRVKSPCASI